MHSCSWLTFNPSESLPINALAATKSRAVKPPDFRLLSHPTVCWAMRAPSAACEGTRACRSSARALGCVRPLPSSCSVPVLCPRLLAAASLPPAPHSHAMLSRFTNRAATVAHRSIGAITGARAARVAQVAQPARTQVQCRGLNGQSDAVDARRRVAAGEERAGLTQLVSLAPLPSLQSPLAFSPSPRRVLPSWPRLIPCRHRTPRRCGITASSSRRRDRIAPASCTT